MSGNGAPVKPLPCLVCGKDLEAIRAHSRQPYGSTFTTYGQYGSAVFDPMDGTFLSVNVCDACLVEAGNAGRVLFTRILTVSRPDFEKVWSPSLPDSTNWTSGPISEAQLVAVRVLASIVRSEYPAGYSLVEIAKTWGEGIASEDIAALERVERDHPEISEQSE